MIDDDIRFINAFKKYKNKELTDEDVELIDFSYKSPLINATYYDFCGDSRVLMKAIKFVYNFVKENKFILENKKVLREYLQSNGKNVENKHFYEVLQEYKKHVDLSDKTFVNVDRFFELNYYKFIDNVSYDILIEYLPLFKELGILYHNNSLSIPNKFFKFLYFSYYTYDDILFLFTLKFDNYDNYHGHYTGELDHALKNPHYSENYQEYIYNFYFQKLILNHMYMPEIRESEQINFDNINDIIDKYPNVFEYIQYEHHYDYKPYRYLLKYHKFLNKFHGGFTLDKVLENLDKSQIFDEIFDNYKKLYDNETIKYISKKINIKNIDDIKKINNGQNIDENKLQNYLNIITLKQKYFSISNKFF